MPKTNQNDIFWSFRGEINFENLLVSEKTTWKPSTRTKYSFSHLLSVEFGGGADNIWEG